MSQAQAPCVPKNSFSNHGGWRDEDFYRIKLVCDRVDRIGFWYYLFHPRHALRDFTLWLRFKNIVKPKKTRIRTQRPKFNWGKKRKVEVKEVKSVQKEVVEVKEEVDTKLKEMLKSISSSSDGYDTKKE